MPPCYEYRCPRGHDFERVLPVADYKTPQECECGAMGRRVLSLPAIMVRPECNYTSPIDGRPITSWRARKEDLARNNCEPYDPDRKQDYDRRIKDDETRLDAAVDATVEAEIEKMPARKRELLEAELKSGVTAEPVRSTAPLKPIREEIHRGE